MPSGVEFVALTPNRSLCRRYIEKEPTVPSIYDRLTDHIGDDDTDKPSGVTPLDIAGLPADQRRVMFVLLRDSEGLSADALQKKVPEVENLGDTLTELITQGWLVRFGDSPNEYYKVNLRPKRGSSLSSGLWGNLTDRLNENDDSG
jgi:hypothetical protein